MELRAEGSRDSNAASMRCRTISGNANPIAALMTRATAATDRALRCALRRGSSCWTANSEKFELPSRGVLIERMESRFHRWLPASIFPSTDERNLPLARRAHHTGRRPLPAILAWVRTDLNRYTRSTHTGEPASSL